MMISRDEAGAWIRMNAALSAAAAVDGADHKQWVIDQMVRALTGPDYDRWVRSYCAGEDGPETYQWDEGVAP
jgi:hypothetical protein